MIDYDLLFKNSKPKQISIVDQDREQKKKATVKEINKAINDLYFNDNGQIPTLQIILQLLELTLLKNKDYKNYYKNKKIIDTLILFLKAENEIITPEEMEKLIKLDKEIQEANNFT